MNNMIMWSINSALWFGAIGAWALPNAIDAEHKNSITVSEQRNADNVVDLDEGYVYQVSNGKAYKMVDGLASNEWVPLTSDGYVDDYDQSAKAREIKAANESLKRVKGG